jgi:spermidine synthase
MAQFLHERFPQAQITGVEIDPMMIELAKKYFGLGNWRYLNVIIADAADYIRRYYGKDAFDMVVSDVFVGCDRPESLDSHDHIRGIFRVLNPGGIYITNCSYLPAYRKASDRYLSRVRSVFSGVEIIKSYPNFLVRAYK